MRNGEYEMIIAPNDWPGQRYRGRYCYEHQYVYWKKYGKIPRTNTECIHHKNGNRRDNKIENLSLISKKKHNYIHNFKGKTIALKCAMCGKDFKRPPKNINFKRSRGQTSFYCSRKCAWKAQKKTAT